MAYVYCGAELDLFAAAENWKSYVRAAVRRYLGREVLEVARETGTPRGRCAGVNSSAGCVSSLMRRWRISLAREPGEASYPTAAAFGLARWRTSMRMIFMIRFFIWTCSNTSRTTTQSWRWRRLSSRRAGI